MSTEAAYGFANFLTRLKITTSSIQVSQLIFLLFSPFYKITLLYFCSLCSPPQHAKDFSIENRADASAIVEIILL
jgi:hypothetical protein